MAQAFDKAYWQGHWRRVAGHAPDREVAPNPYLAAEIGGLRPGTALDAGCGQGAEAVWLATEGWLVTAADISKEALSRASRRAAGRGVASERIRWVEADLSAWQPGEQFDLVMTHYAHPAMPQLAFYERLCAWVVPGGTLLIVGHLHRFDSPEQGHGDGHGDEQQGDRHRPPAEASVTAPGITNALDPAQWDVITADEPIRTVTSRAGRTLQLHDVVVRATRRR